MRPSPNYFDHFLMSCPSSDITAVLYRNPQDTTVNPTLSRTIPYGHLFAAFKDSLHFTTIACFSCGFNRPVGHRQFVCMPARHRTSQWAYRDCNRSARRSGNLSSVSACVQESRAQLSAVMTRIRRRVAVRYKMAVVADESSSACARRCSMVCCQELPCASLWWMTADLLARFSDFCLPVSHLNP